MEWIGACDGYCCVWNQCELNSENIVIHQITACFYYASVYLTFEVTNIFLNIHWFCDKVMNSLHTHTHSLTHLHSLIHSFPHNIQTNRSGGTLQLVNGIVLLLGFIFVRLWYGLTKTYQLMLFCIVEWENPRQGQFFQMVALIYAMATTVVHSLNVYWFFAIIRSLLARMRNAPRKPKVHHDGNHAHLNGKEKEKVKEKVKAQ